MSRNLRRKSSALPAKQPARKRSHTNDNSSDDDYAGVDLISEAEDDEEPDVEEAEEQAIIEDPGSDGDDELQDVSRPVDFDQSSWNGFDEESVLGGNEAFFDDHMARIDAPDTFTNATFNTPEDQSDDEEPETTRRVRFDLSDSSSSDNDAVFPDIFVEQDSLDPTFLRIIESNDLNAHNVGSSEDGSYWDYRGEDTNNVIEVPDDESESGSSSGYETDEGETTEEDLPNVARYVPARSVLRHTSTDSDDESEQEIIAPRRSVRRKPKLGSWVHDRQRPFVTFDQSGKKLLVFNSGRRHSMPDIERTSPVESDMESPSVDQSPMISNSGNLMISAMYGSVENYLGALGPPEAFIPFTNISADGTIAQESFSSNEEDDATDDDMLNVEEFLNLADAESVEEEMDTLEDSGETSAVKPSSTPAHPTKVTSEDQIHPLLDHFNNGNVGAFRRNQNLHHLLSRNTATRESLAFSGPFSQGAIRGMKANRLAAANTPITPIRRQNFAGMMLPPGSHIHGPPTRKRKFSGEVYSHKRHRNSL